MHLGPLRHYHNPLSSLRLPVYSLQTSHGTKQKAEREKVVTIDPFASSFFLFLHQCFPLQHDGVHRGTCRQGNNKCFPLSLCCSVKIFFSQPFHFVPPPPPSPCIFSHFLKRYWEATTLSNILELFVFNPFVRKLSFIKCLSFSFHSHLFICIKDKVSQALNTKSVREQEGRSVVWGAQQ